MNISYCLKIMISNVLSLVVLITLTACGGGGGSNTNNDVFTLSTSTLSFISETPSIQVTAQPITGTVKGELTGTLYILITADGNAVSSVSNLIIDKNTQSGTTYVTPMSSSVLGVGTHTSTVTVRACLNDATCSTGELAGSPKTVSVNYEVKSSVHEETVMPHVVKSGLEGDVIIRGYNFFTDNVTDISFGDSNATSFSIVSDTEIRAAYPVLTAGTHAVQLSNNSGITSFSGNLVATDSPAFSAGSLQYPSSPGQVLATIYDAEREALFVAASDFNSINFNTTSRQTNRIIRFQFSNGGLSSIDTSVIPLLQGMTLTPDGRQLLAITDTHVLHLNPLTMEQTNSTTVSGIGISSQYFKGIVATNDGNALITTAYVGSGSTSTYLYPISEPNLYKTNLSLLYNGSAGVSADGSHVTFIEGSLSPAQPLRSYSSSTGLFSTLSVTKNQKQCINSYMGRCNYPVLDKTGNRIAVIDSAITVNIYDSVYNLLGILPISTELVVFNADGTKIYAYDSGNTLRTYDLISNTVNGMFQEIGSGTTLAGSPGTGIQKMILSADGSTIFIAGSSNLIIQPAP